jgi:hypothetical protein
MPSLEDFARKCHLWNDEYLLSELQKGPSGYAKLDYFRIIEAEAEGRGLAPLLPLVPVGATVPPLSGPLLRRLWRGEVSLVETYWVWGVAVNVLLTLVLMLTGTAVPVIALLALIFAASYLPFIAVAIWRSADRYQGPAIWPVLARTVVIIRIVRFLWIVWQSV